jgi:lipid-binding SYLF domain-containing protein
MGVVLLTICVSATDSMAQTFLSPITDGPTSTESGIINESAVVLQELASGTTAKIPESLWKETYGVVIVPHYVRGAFVIGVAGGRGLLVTRDQNGNWLAPEFVTLAGGSFGWQAGVQSTDLVLILRTPRSIANIRQGKLTLGADISAAAGPIGRYAGVATDASLQAEILTYSRSRGLFAGASLSGAALQMDIPATQRYYQMGPANPGTVPRSAVALVNELVTFSTASAEVSSATEASTAAEAAATRPVTLDPDPNFDELVNSIASLQTKVDEQWRQYLAIPSDWANGRRLTSADIHAVLVRYERVDTNPQFAALRTQPEFQTAIKIFRKMAMRAEDNSTIALPPPPGQ